MKKIILVRHGQNSMVGKRLAGWLPDVHLNEVGQAQVAALAERLTPQRGQIHALYSSPLERTMETARPLAEVLGLEIQPLAGIGEVHYGEWEGQSIDDLSKLEEWKVVQGFPSAMRFPGGEGMREAQMRAVVAVEEVASRLEEKQSAIIVSHADLIKAVAAHYAGIHFDLFQRLVISPASLTIIGLTPTAPRILCLNDSAHLPPGEDPEMKSDTPEQEKEQLSNG
ncbi:MAG: MSMEG_4193 family putative phosphomutase [Ardenticatenales bacterium]|nr:MSMEG_4193 family putative phosphomutase [Ardenticatenales bacterium]